MANKSNASPKKKTAPKKKAVAKKSPAGPVSFEGEVDEQDYPEAVDPTPPAADDVSGDARKLDMSGVTQPAGALLAVVNNSAFPVTMKLGKNPQKLISGGRIQTMYIEVTNDRLICKALIAGADGVIQERDVDIAIRPGLVICGNDNVKLS